MNAFIFTCGVPCGSLGAFEFAKFERGVLMSLVARGGFFGLCGWWFFACCVLLLGGGKVFGKLWFGRELPKKDVITCYEHIDESIL